MSEGEPRITIMAEKLEYELTLKDLFTGTIKSATEAATGFGDIIEGVSKVVEKLGVDMSLLNSGDFFKKGVESFELLQNAETQLRNSLENTGHYSDETFNSLITGADELSKHIAYSSGEIVDLESRLSMIGNISKDQISQVAEVSADVAAKLHITLAAAGDLLSKGLNDPRLATGFSQLMIDPSVAAGIKKLADEGQTGIARMKLLDEVQHKVAGSARQAFETNPASAYNKAIEELQLSVGQVGVEILTALKPALDWFAEKLEGLTEDIKDFSVWLKDHQQVIRDVADVLAIGAAAYVTYSLGVKAALFYEGLQKVYEMWVLVTSPAFIAYYGEMTLAQWALNVAMDANPVGLIAVALAGLIAIIYDTYKKTDLLTTAVLFMAGPVFGTLIYFILKATNGFGKFKGFIHGIKDALISFAKNAIDIFSGLGEVISGVFERNLDKVHKGLAKTKGALHDVKDAYTKGMAESLADDEKKQQSEDKKATTGPPVKPNSDWSLPFKGNNTVTNLPSADKATGTKSVTINIAINKQIETLNIKTTNLTDTGSKIQEHVAEALTNAVNQSQVIAGGR